MLKKKVKEEAHKSFIFNVYISMTTDVLTKFERYDQKLQKPLQGVLRLASETERTNSQVENHF